MTRSFRSIAALAGCTAAALLCACGPSTGLPADIASCASPKAICMASASATPECIDLTSDVNNCGTCGNVCGVPQQGGTAACVAGECQMGCSNGLTVCGVAEAVDGGGGPDGGAGAPICVDTTVDPNHCGSCGVRCLDSQICTASACVPAGTPAQGTTGCGFSADGGVILKNLQTDPANCGACGNACAASEICQQGACDPCPVTQCNNVCVDTNTDVNNCGACGVVTPSCNDGVPQLAPVITALPSLSTGFLISGATQPLSVKVVSGTRLAEVTVVAKSSTGAISNPLKLTSSSSLDFSPTVWTFSWSALTTAGMTTPITAPAAATTVEFDFSAFDEQYMVGRSDSGSHTATLVVNTQVITPAALTFMPTTIATSFGGDAGVPVSATSWIPLNGGPVVITGTLASAPTMASGIVGMEFHSSGESDIALGGVNSVLPLTTASASITVNPNDLGTGARAIYVAQVDVFGNRYPSASVEVVVGDITPYSGISSNPVLAHGTDGNDTIWLFGAATTVSGSPCAGTIAAPIFSQPYDQPVLGSSAIGKVVDGTSTFCTTNVNMGLIQTPDLTGVYAVKSDGTSIARFDPTETATFITAPSGTKFSNIRPLGVTQQAMAIDDSNGNGWFANATKGTGDPAPEEAGGVDGGPFDTIVSVGQTTSDNHDIGTSDAGADWAFVNVNTGSAAVQHQLDIFHPAITGNGGQPHIKSYLAAASSVPRSLTVFPGGEYVWEEVDTSGDLALGAGRFDGVDQPVDLTNAALSVDGGTPTTLAGNALAIGAPSSLTSTAFFVPTPGVLVGLVPSKATTTAGQGSTGNNRSPDIAGVSAGYEVLEIDLTASPAKIYHPQLMTTLPSGVPVGQVLESGVTDRYGNFNTFTVSDDLKKVLFVTKAPASPTGSPAGLPAHDLYTINLLDLASGAVTAVYSSEYINNNDTVDNSGNGALNIYPHFLHGMNSYAGLGASSTTPPIIVWAEELPVGGVSTNSSETVYERLFYANYSSSTITANQIDRLGYAAYDVVAPQNAAAVGLSLRQLVAESVTGNAIYFLSDDGGGELSLYVCPFGGSTTSQLVSKGVTNWRLREDIGKQEVLRNDGTLLVGALAGNAPLAPVYKTDAGALTDTTLMSLSGFTPDGSKVWALVNLGQYLYLPQQSSSAVVYVDGTLVTVDLTSGARTDWGDSVSDYLQIGDPLFAFLGATSSLYGFDQASNSDLAPGFFNATSAAPTAHSELLTTLPPPPFDQAVEQETQYSLDLNEAYFAVSSIGAFDLTTSKSNFAQLPANASLTYPGQAARVQPDLASYGVSHLPLWAIYEGTSSTGVTGTVFKDFGGATFQAPITISAGNTTTPSVTNAPITPDFSQVLGAFKDSNSLPYEMKLPGPGVAPFPAVVP